MFCISGGLNIAKVTIRGFNNLCIVKGFNRKMEIHSQKRDVHGKTGCLSDALDSLESHYHNNYVDLARAKSEAPVNKFIMTFEGKAN